LFRRILIPTDFSTASEWVFDDAVRIAGGCGAELVILHVRLRDRVRRANADIATRLIVRQAPDPGNEICRTARAEGADLIVIATHARHHVAHLLIGSTTLAVLREPPAPVLAIRYGTRKRTSMNRVVVPAHPEEKSRAALALAKEMTSGIHIVTVCGEKDRPRAEELLRELAVQTPGATTAILEGDDAEREIVRYVARHDIDAIFLNAAGHEPSEGKLDIVRHAPVPVMIVP
jgi:nucleotide-binding universal stress UspA family protein